MSSGTLKRLKELKSRTGALIFCWVIDFQASLSPSFSFAPALPDSDELCPDREAYFPCSSPHSSAMLCIQNAEISPGGLLSNKEYTVTGQEKEENERAGVTRYR